VRVRSGESISLYIHSALPNDQAIVYGNQRGKVTHKDSFIEVFGLRKPAGVRTTLHLGDRSIPDWRTCAMSPSRRGIPGAPFGPTASSSDRSPTKQGSDARWRVRLCVCLDPHFSSAQILVVES
jgi:hypothetical protein